MISSADYQFIADRIGHAKANGPGMAFNLLSMRSHLRDNEVAASNEFKLWLTKIITDTYDVIVESHLRTPPILLNFVDILQTHVEKHYGSVDAFLSSNGVKVNQDFADLSDEAGFEIDLANIE